jgi:hypothetical protein
MSRVIRNTPAINKHVIKLTLPENHDAQCIMAAGRNIADATKKIKIKLYSIQS